MIGASATVRIQQWVGSSASDSAIGTLLERGLIAHNPHHLFVTTRAVLELLALCDLAEFPDLAAQPSPIESPAATLS